MSSYLLSDFCGSLAIKFLKCDSAKIVDPRVKLTFQEDCISSEKMSAGTFNL